MESLANSISSTFMKFADFAFTHFVRAIAETMIMCALFALCVKPAAGQVIDPNSTCNNNSGQTSTNICYDGGNVMAAPTNAYVIYYGNWATSTQTIVNNWLHNVGGTNLFGINAAYHDSAGFAVQNILNFPYNGVAYTNAYQDYQNAGDDYQTLGTQLNGDAAIRQIVSDVISAHHLPADTNGVYFVLTAWNVSQINTGFGSFCSAYIAYHASSTAIISGSTIKYAMVGNPLYSTQCSQYFDGNYLRGDSTTPNGNLAADAVINLIFHELSEAVTDPTLLTWGGTRPHANENGDLCEWNFADTAGFSHLPMAGNGAHYNITIAGINYLIQKLFQVRVTSALAQGSFYPGSCEMGNVSITSSLNPSTVGQAVTLSATVAGLAGRIPTGTVTFYFGYGGQIGNPTTLVNGQGNITYTFNNSKNPAYIYAVYSGDTYYDRSNSPLLYQVINQ